MAVFSHPLFSTDRGTEAGIRQRFQSSDFLSYTLSGDDVSRYPKFPLQAVALKFFGDPGWWVVLADANQVKGAWEWQVGDKVRIPRDFSSSVLGVSLVNNPLLRKTY